MKNPRAPEVDASDSEQPPVLDTDCRDVLSTTDVSFRFQEAYFVRFRLCCNYVSFLRGGGSTVRDFTQQKDAAVFGGCVDPAALAWGHRPGWLTLTL